MEANGARERGMRADGGVGFPKSHGRFVPREQTGPKGSGNGPAAWHQETEHWLCDGHPVLVECSGGQDFPKCGLYHTTHLGGLQ